MRKFETSNVEELDAFLQCNFPDLNLETLYGPDSVKNINKVLINAGHNPVCINTEKVKFQGEVISRVVSFEVTL
jgi:hypothetical protein